MKTVISLISVMVLFCGTGFSADLLVPNDFAKIQSAIQAAQDGDRVLIADGLYRERLNFLGKAITVCGNLNAPQQVIIKPDTAGSVVVFKNGEGENSVLCGVTLRGANTDFGGGAYIRDASPTLQNLVIDSCTVTGSGGGIYVTLNSDPLLENIVLRTNKAKNGGGASIYNGAEATLRQIIIEKSTTSTSGGGIHVSRNSKIIAENVTIKGCNTSGHGGGIYVADTSAVTLTNFLISDCQSTAGAGILCGVKSTLVARQGKLLYNRANYEGGGFYMNGNNPSIVEHVLLVGNFAGDYGSAFYTWGSFPDVGQSHIFNHLTITKHSPRFDPNGGEGEVFGYLILLAPKAKLTNSIIWGNESEVIGAYDGAQVAYSLIVSRDNIGAANIGDGVITGDPQFNNDPDINDYPLENSSPCVDSADPNSPKDADSSRADMGFVTAVNVSTISGRVTTFELPRPIEGATVRTSYGYETETDAEGHYLVPYAPRGEFSITVSKDQFLDSTRTGIIRGNDSLTFNFQMSAPILVASVESVKVELEQGTEQPVAFFVKNEGTGPIRWQVKPLLGDGWSGELLSLHGYIQLPVDEDLTINAVAYCQDHYIYACHSIQSKLIIVTTKEGIEVRRFDQPGDGANYITDMVSDGELVYGVRWDKVYSISLLGECIELFNTERERSGSIAWDSERNLLWLTDIDADSPIHGYNLNGDMVKTVDKQPMVITGLAFWEDEPDGLQLFAFTRVEGNAKVIQFNVDNAAPRVVGLLVPPEGTPPYRSCTISDRIAPYGGVTLLSPVNVAKNNRVAFWSLKMKLDWIEIPNEQQAGVLQAGEEIEIPLKLTTTDLDTGIYEASLRFDHTGISDPIIIPITLTVVPEESVNGDAQTLPAEFAVTSLFPNPFNAWLNIAYSLPSTSDVTIALYDLSGREVFSQPGFGIQAGTHNLSISATQLPTGVYLVKLHSSHGTIVKKALLLK